MGREALEWIDSKLRVLEERHLRRVPTTRERRDSATIVVDGQSLINFGSNDYLGLAGDPRLARAAIETIDSEGVGAGASSLVTGRTVWHERLETRLAEFHRAEAALVMSSGFSANLATIAALVGPGDVIFSDERNHASIIDGCRLSRAETVVYRHADANHLEEALRECGVRGRRLVVTDTVFSMDGDAAPLRDIVDISGRYGAMLMIDEAHATGVFGERGTGLAETVGVTDAVDVHVGTLSKALGAAGGYVVGSRRLIDWLYHRARAYVFSTAPPAAVCAAALASLDIVRDEPERRERLLRMAATLRETLSSAGLDTGASTTQIVPVVVGEAGRSAAFAARLRQEGLFVPGIRPPTVPLGHALLRISLSYLHSDAMIESLAAALGNCRD